MIRDIFEIATPLDLREMLESVPRIERRGGQLAIVKFYSTSWIVYLHGKSWNLLFEPYEAVEVFTNFLDALHVFIELDHALQVLADPIEAAKLVAKQRVSEN